ncbi:hypothetical protein BDV93DRAFT_256087 [Ceratobasidium sp. AG-I]|nr:hypothetical protein BDV93DRAFT_256087 [Ceratobasidium sp. AG-I]
MEFTSAYLTPPYLSPDRRHRGEPLTPTLVPPTIRPRSSGDVPRWHPYSSSLRVSTPTGPRSATSLEPERVPSAASSRKSWPQPTSRSQYPYPAYEPTTYSRQHTPPNAPGMGGSAFYFTPDPSPPSARHARNHSYSVPPTIDDGFSAFNSFGSALPQIPVRYNNAPREFDGAASIPLCSIDSPHARAIFVQQAYDTLMSIYYCPSPASSHGSQGVFVPVMGSLPIDPATLHWFTSELIRRASVPNGVVKQAISYIARARSAARRACEARAPLPISPPPSPSYAVPPQLGSRDAYNKRSRGVSASPGPELADPRQMLLGALVLSQKFLVDAAYTSATWGRLSGLPTSDVTAVERVLGAALDWRLWEKDL